MRQRETLCYFVEGDQVYLGVGQRNIVRGKRTGYGGKAAFIQRGQMRIYEPMPLAARREAFSETGGVVPLSLERRAILLSTYKGVSHEVHVFVSDRFLGEFRDTPEMQDHALFPIGNLPYEQMWQNDALWLQRVLNGEHLLCAFHLGEQGEVERYKIARWNR